MVRPIVIDPNDAVKDLNIMLQRLIGAKIKVTIITGEQIGHVRADSGHIGQVLLNLILNARDAMPQGGEITVETCNVRLDESYAYSHKGMVSGNYVMLSVRDTGTGMTEDVKTDCFSHFLPLSPMAPV
jgi:signal transduction histidine kinase